MVAIQQNAEKLIAETEKQRNELASRIAETENNATSSQVSYSSVKVK